MIDNIRSAYFALLDRAVEVSGNSKKDLHEYYKRYMFPFLFEDPLNFNEASREIDMPPNTTKSLSETGWKTFYDEFRHFCADKFNI